MAENDEDLAKVRRLMWSQMPKIHAASYYDAERCMYVDVPLETPESPPDESLDGLPREPTRRIVAARLPMAGDS